MKIYISIIGMIFLLTACVAERIEPQSVIQSAERISTLPSVTQTAFQPESTTEIPVPTPAPLLLTGAGDISICGEEMDDRTAGLLLQQSSYVFTLGDNQYDNGTLREFENCFHWSWGQYKERMIPAIGNHEYATKDARGYFDYFGELAGPREKGYYSKDIGSWHVVVLNSECTHIDGCDSASEMLQWLEDDLLKNQRFCTLAIWHTPRYSSGWHGDAPILDPLWRMVVENDVELVLNGHEHNYERFAPMNENGTIDFENGTREFVVGTGGADLRVKYTDKEASEVFDSSTYGVIQLTLAQDSYTWQFIPLNESGFRDAGQARCH